MAVGRDQSANLSGMLNQIAETTGAMGEAYKPITDALEATQAPKYDPDNPESIKAYQNYLIGIGKHGVASQLNHVLEASMKRKSEGLLNDFSVNSQKLANINTGISANGNNPRAMGALQTALTGAQAEQASLQALIDADPYARGKLQEASDEEVKRKREALALQKEQLAQQVAQANATEQKLANGIATGILSGQLDLSAYKEDPQAFLADPENAQIAKAIADHPEAFEDAVKRVDEFNTDMDTIAKATEAKKEYSEDEITGEDGLNLPESVWKAYQFNLNQFGSEYANKKLRDNASDVFKDAIKTEQASTQVVYNSTTIPMFKQTVAGDLLEISLSGGTIDKNNPIEDFFGVDEDMEYSAEQERLQKMLEDEDTVRAISGSVVTAMQGDKADPSDPEARQKYVFEALERMLGYTPEDSKQAEPKPEPETATDSRGRKKKTTLRTIATQAEYDALPEGTEFLNADGSTAIKPRTK